MQETSAGAWLEICERSAGLAMEVKLGMVTVKFNLVTTGDTSITGKLDASMQIPTLP